ncbi:hypothetical protein [Micromonospora sp. KC723]|nr:hypothetical protein [Micromonospora sp. KC723]
MVFLTDRDGQIVRYETFDCYEGSSATLGHHGKVGIGESGETWLAL